MKVPGVNLPAMGLAPVWCANFRMARWREEKREREREKGRREQCCSSATARVDECRAHLSVLPVGEDAHIVWVLDGGDDSSREQNLLPCLAEIEDRCTCTQCNSSESTAGVKSGFYAIHNWSENILQDQ